MIPFARATRELSDGQLGPFVARAALASSLLALMEAGGVVLVVPLLQALQGSEITLPLVSDFLTRALGPLTDLQFAAAVGSLVFVLFVTKSVLSLAYLRWSIGVILRLEADCAGRLLDAYLSERYESHLGRTTSRRQAAINDMLHKVYCDGLIGLVGALADVVVMSAIGICLLVVEPLTTIGVALYLAVVAFVYQRQTHGRIAGAGAALVDDLARAHGVVHDALGTWKTTVLGGHQHYWVERLTDAKIRAAGRHGTLMMAFRAPRYLLELALVVGVAVLASVLFSNSDPIEATATLGLFLTAGFRLLPGLNRVLGAVSTSRSLVSVTQELVRDLGVETGQSAAGPVPDRRAGRIQLEDVHYSYDRSTDAVAGVDLQIEPGSFVGVLGRSGSGKSTLLDLLLGLLQPTRGQMALGLGEPDESLSAWQRSIGFVPQHVHIIEDTVRRNVAFGLADDSIDDARVRTCLRMAALDELLALPEVLDLDLLEGGSRLSGGQRQRLGIARALYGDPRVLVLDEVTSSLDIGAEGRVVETIAGLAGERTVIMVTHRWESVSRCDYVIGLDDGRLTHLGRPDGLSRQAVENLVRRSTSE